MILLNTLTCPNSGSTACADTTSLTATYSVYEIVFENLVPATNTVNLNLQVHSGGTFLSTNYGTTSISSNAGAVFGSGAATTTAITLLQSQGNIAPDLSGSVRVHTPSTTTAPKMWVGQFGGNTSGPAALYGVVSGFWNSNPAVDGFQVSFSSGNISSGVIKIYGIQ
jgi:hypothetical protein